MIRAPRCPVCRTWLSADRTIDETFLPDEAAWNYRYACASCLSVVVQRIPEISESRPRVTASAPSIDIAGAVVARVLTGLRDAAGEGRLADVVTLLVRDEQRRLLLRIPEVFTVARPGWGETVRIADPLFYSQVDPFHPALTAAMFETAVLGRYDPAVAGTSVRTLLASGDRMRVLRVEEARFVLERVSTSRMDLLTKSCELVAAPDLVVPDLGSVG